MTIHLPASTNLVQIVGRHRRRVHQHAVLAHGQEQTVEIDLLLFREPRPLEDTWE